MPLFLRHKLKSATVLATAMIFAGFRPAEAQLLLAPQGRVSLELQPTDTRVLNIPSEPHSLQVIEVDLGGGLVGLRSSETVRRLLDLGRGGHLHYAVEVPESGVASVELTSGEHLRSAQVSIELVTETLTQEQRLHLHAAGIAFALADSTRRHQPHAPDVTAALNDYEQAAADAAAAGDPSLQRWALIQKARFLLYQKSNFVETWQLLERAAALPDADDAATLALLYKTLSSCEYFLGNLPESVVHGEHALSLYRETGDQYWQGIVLGNLIAGYGEMGRDEDAAVAAREGLTDAEQTQDTAGVVFCLTELANLYRKQGFLQLAFQSFREAQTWAQDIRYAPLVQAEIEQALGEFYMELGLWSEAQAQLDQCLKHASPNSALAVLARGLLARTADRRGDVQTSLRAYGDAIIAARELKLIPEETGLLLGRSATMLKAHRTSAALEDARTAAELAEKQNSSSLRIEAALAEGAACLEGCNDPLKARKIYQKALEWIEQTGEREQESIAYAGLARVDGILGDSEAGIQNSEHALVLLEHSRASFASRDLAASYFVERRSWYALATDFAVRLDQLHPGQGYGEKAFQFTERARARAMLDVLGDPDSGDRNRSSASTALLHRIAANQYRIEAQKAQLLSDADPGKAAGVLQSLYREQDALEAERKSEPKISPSQNLNEVTSIGNIQTRLLDTETALIAIAPGEHASYRWFITRTSVRLDVLPSMEDLDRRLEPLQDELQQRRPPPQPGEDAAIYNARLAASDEQRNLSLQRAGSLLLPAMPANIHHLFLVADDALQTVPWNALRITRSGREYYAIERYTFSVEPSASVAVALAGHPARVGRESALVVSDTLSANAPAVPRWRQLEALPGSQREAKTIAELLPPKDFRNLRRADATVSNLSQSLQANISFLHIAAHTLLVTGHPELSGIALSAGRDHANKGQGILWLHDIPQLSAPPLVVLSGCTTQGANISGEELNTLTQAFFYAGAQQVIASSWQIEDNATADLMEHFYRNLIVHRMPAADALRSAQLHMLAQGADLADWAAFLIDGVSARSPVLDSVRR